MHLKNLLRNFFVSTMIITSISSIGAKDNNDARVKLTDFPKGEQTQVFLPLNGKRTIKQAVVIGTGILDEDLISKLEKEVKIEHSFKDRKNLICYTTEKIPQHYQCNKITNHNITEAKEWPKINLETELNIPAFRWRIYQHYEDKKFLLGDWPVVVGNPFGGRGYRPTPLGKNEIYAIEHFPDFADPLNKKNKAAPGSKKNPFQEWKFLYKKGTGFYFHGTDKEYLLEKKRRMFSHGCVRNYNWNIDKLAALVLRNENMLEVYDKECGRKKEQDWNKFYQLKQKIPASNIYDTIEVFVSSEQEKSYATFYPNVYRYDAWRDEQSQDKDFVSLTTVQHLKADLQKAGYDIALFDEQKLKTAVEKMKNIKEEQIIFVKDLISM